MFNAAILDKTAKVLVQQRQRASSPTILRFFAHWGGIGLVPLAILDSSPIPTFGSLDILTAFLSARHSDLWLYYACMATFGAMIGSYFTYKLGQKTGLAWIEKNFGARRSQQVEHSSVGDQAQSSSRLSHRRHALRRCSSWLPAHLDTGCASFSLRCSWVGPSVTGC